MRVNQLKSIIKKIFIKHKLSNEHANVCTNAIINAELVGASSHGVSRVKMYCDRIKKKLINPQPKIKFKKISNSIFHVDANNGMGFISADKAIKKAIYCAKKTGFSLVGIKNSSHYGLSGYYAEQAVKKNLIALCFTNAPPAIAPFGSRKAFFGTNPICFGAPSGSKVPFIFDASISKINRGKIRYAAKINKKIPLGFALDKKGQPTTDPNKALQGVQLPISGFVGSGLAWIVDILSGVITGGNHAGKVKDPFDDFSGPQNVGHLFIVFKPNLFVSDYKKRIKQNIKLVKKLPKIKGTSDILYPGQNKFQRYKKNMKKNIQIPKAILDDLKNL
tara:strand:- start:491 stop:1489 length:999 start_codon:yes stop_codon:yes gene_type:complete